MKLIDLARVRDVVNAHATNVNAYQEPGALPMGNVIVTGLGLMAQACHLLTSIAQSLEAIAENQD